MGRRTVPGRGDRRVEQSKRSRTMSRRSHDVYQDHYMLAWAEADQARMRSLCAEERLSRQVRATRSAGLHRRLATLLRPVRAGMELLAGLPTCVADNDCGTGWSIIARARCYPTMHVDGLTLY